MAELTDDDAFDAAVTRLAPQHHRDRLTELMVLEQQRCHVNQAASAEPPARVRGYFGALMRTNVHEIVSELDSTVDRVERSLSRIAMAGAVTARDALVAADGISRRHDRTMNKALSGGSAIASATLWTADHVSKRHDSTLNRMLDEGSTCAEVCMKNSSFAVQTAAFVMVVMALSALVTYVMMWGKPEATLVASLVAAIVGGTALLLAIDGTAVGRLQACVRRPTAVWLASYKRRARRGVELSAYEAWVMRIAACFAAHEVVVDTVTHHAAEVAKSAAKRARAVAATVGMYTVAALRVHGDSRVGFLMGVYVLSVEHTPKFGGAVFSKVVGSGGRTDTDDCDHIYLFRSVKGKYFVSNEEDMLLGRHAGTIASTTLTGENQAPLGLKWKVSHGGSFEVNEKLTVREESL